MRTAQEANNAEEDAAEERGEAQQAVTQLEAGQRPPCLLTADLVVTSNAVWPRGGRLPSCLQHHA